MKIAIAGTGYVGLSNAILLAQHHEVHTVDLIEEKVNMINRGKSRGGGLPRRGICHYLHADELRREEELF